MHASIQAAHQLHRSHVADRVSIQSKRDIVHPGDELYACNTSLIGSIGVVGSTFGAVELIKRLGIERRVAVAGVCNANK